MEEWLRAHGWSLDETEVFLALLAVVGGFAAGLRKIDMRGLWRWMEFRTHIADRSYYAWFNRVWGYSENPYLREFGRLDLSHTYVSLTFHGAESDRRVDADLVLTDRSLGNIMIEGVPGSGKSTLLRAFGVGASRGPRREVPLLVPLRRYARALASGGGGLADFVVHDILVSGWGRSPRAAAAYLRSVLVSGRAVVLLDGLDEVPTQLRERVLAEVYRFVQDHDPRLPTARARLVVTCRQYTYLTLRERWVPVVGQRVYTLAPLRDAEIFAYLTRLADRFRDPRTGPEEFLHAIRASGTLDLHRTPLVLAMSVGLYARRTSFDLPGEVAEQYGEMVSELLERQAFKADPGTGLLRYSLADKRRFLREFAARNALASVGGPDTAERFGEFPRAELYRWAADLAPDLDAVDDPRAFVDEIVDRSGLVVRIADGGCTFVHRSVQEYLVAEHLRHFDPTGADTLLERAADPEWRQVVLFYTGTHRLGQRAADALLTGLAGRDLALAGHCLAGAPVTTAVAEGILRRLADRIRERRAVAECVSAVLTATRSPRTRIRDLAADLTRDVLGAVIGHPDVVDLLGGDVDGVVRVLRALAGTDATHIAELVPKLVAAAPDDARLVEPLWLCLAAPGLADQPGAARIVERLLLLAMTPDGLRQLLRQEPRSPAFADQVLRRRVYPFRRGHPLSSNLVTVLCWAEYLGAVPIPENRFVEARRSDPGLFARVEGDRGRTRKVSPHRWARWWSGAGAAAAGAGLLAGAGRVWGSLVGAAGGLLLWWVLAPAVVAGMGYFLAVTWARQRPPTGVVGRYLRAGAAPGAGRTGQALAEACARLLPAGTGQVAFLLSTLAYPVACLPLLAASPVGYAMAATGFTALVGWVPLLCAFDRDTVVYLYRPNPFSDMYDDPRSRLWLDPGAADRVPRARRVDRPHRGHVTPVAQRSEGTR